jgi:hypothetical protein
MKGDFGLLRIGYAACQRNAKNDQILIVKELLRLQGATWLLHKKTASSLSHKAAGRKRLQLAG